MAAICIFLQSCAETGWETMQGIVWHTSYHITYYGPKVLEDSIIAEMRLVEQSVSAFDPHSVVSRINRNETVEIDELFEDVYDAAQFVWAKSDGYFDPTVSPLINIFGFGYSLNANPDTAQIDTIRKYIGLDKTTCKGKKLHKKDPRTEFNFSAIAKGYGCDRIGKLLRRHGVNDYMIEIGGEIALSGKNPDGGKWNIAIDRPHFSTDSVIHDTQMVISLTDSGIATSGNYRNFHVSEDGKRTGHTFDPKKGMPAETDILSATVICENCMTADAYATAIMAMGSQKAIAMIRRENLAAMLILSDGSLSISPQFAPLIKEQ